MEGSEKWIRHYCSKHDILLVGEGDFSFSLCLAKAFGSATNITATSLDSEDELREKYMDAMDNISTLKILGCHVQHEVNVHTMRGLLLYDRIIFNFPHAGSRFFGIEHYDSSVESHKWLVKGFLKNAKEMLKKDGQIHITHKITYPYNEWQIETLAEEEGLKLAEESKFFLGQYPGYNNKRGCGVGISDQPFPTGRGCSTLMFINA